jgi:SulP family sulfate permease
VRPHDAVLGHVKGIDGFHDIEEYPQGSTIPGLIVYRFDAPLFFANADFFQRRVRTLVAETLSPVEWFLLDAEAITTIRVHRRMGSHSLQRAFRLLLGALRAHM